MQHACCVCPCVGSQLWLFGDVMVMGFHFHLVAVHLFDLPLTHSLYDCIYYIDIVCVLQEAYLHAIEHS